MALSYVTYSGSGGTNYSVPFGYISTDDVQVYVDGVLQVEGAANDYTWFNSTTIQFTAGSTPGVGAVVRIERHTTDTARLVDFQDAGNLTEADLDTSANQMFYLAQESIDNFTDNALTITPANLWDAESHRIINVADPVNAQDAMTLNYMETTFLPSITASQAAAAASAAAALVSETNAAASEAAAASSETNSAASEAQAALDVTYAAEWANKAEDSLVSAAAGGDLVDDYSALHWANKAQGYAASLTLPSMSGQALKFLRANAGETSLEYFDLFNTVNTWTVTQIVKASGGSFIEAHAYDVAHDSAFNGHLVKASDGTSRGFFGSIPSDPGSYIAAYTWDDTLGTPAWNRVFGANRAASSLELGTGYTLTYNGSQIGITGNAATWTAAQTISVTSGSAFILNGTGVGAALEYQEGGTIRAKSYYDIGANAMVFNKYRESDQVLIHQMLQYDNGNFQASGIGSATIQGSSVVLTNGTQTCTLDASGVLTNVGSIISSGNLHTNNGSVYSNAQTAGNAHFWLQEGGVNRTVMYYDVAGNSFNIVKYRESDSANVGQLFMSDGGIVMLLNSSCNLTLQGSATAVMNCAVTQINAVASTVNLQVNSASGSAPYATLQENGSNRAQWYYDPTNHYMIFRKYVDATPASVSGQILIYDAGHFRYQDVAGSGKDFYVGGTGNGGRVTWNGPSMEGYGVRMNSSGTKVSGHANFSTSRIAAGQYRVTHNFGTNVAAAALPEGTGGTTLSCKVNYVSANAFDIHVQATSTGTATDTALTVTWSVAV